MSAPAHFIQERTGIVYSSHPHPARAHVGCGGACVHDLLVSCWLLRESGLLLLYCCYRVVFSCVSLFLLLFYTQLWSWSPSSSLSSCFSFAVVYKVNCTCHCCAVFSGDGRRFFFLVLRRAAGSQANLMRRGVTAIQRFTHKGQKRKRKSYCDLFFCGPTVRRPRIRFGYCHPLGHPAVYVLPLSASLFLLDRKEKNCPVVCR